MDSLLKHNGLIFLFINFVSFPKTVSRMTACPPAGINGHRPTATFQVLTAVLQRVPTPVFRYATLCREVSGFPGVSRQSWRLHLQNQTIQQDFLLETPPHPTKPLLSGVPLMQVLICRLLGRHNLVLEDYSPFFIPLRQLLLKRSLVLTSLLVVMHLIASAFSLGKKHHSVLLRNSQPFYQQPS